MANDFRTGARFFDRRKREMGLAGTVTVRPRGLTSLTVIDVSDAAPELMVSLVHLDRSGLSLRHPDTGAMLYEFRWASGYANGTNAVRIQGVVEGSSPLSTF